MRNTETCAIMPRLILEMRGIARIAGTAGGVNRTHKRTLGGQNCGILKACNAVKILFILSKSIGLSRICSERTYVF